MQSVSTNSDNPDLRWTLSDAGPDTSVDTTVPVDATPTEDTTTSEDVPATCESTCDGADTWCEGDEVVECVRGADGCFHEERGECTGCEMVGGDSVCVIRTTCVPTCGIESRYCSAGAVNECAPDEDGCLQFTVSECAEGEVCSEADGTVGCVDPCADVETSCESVGASCEGDVRVTCAPREDGCFVESRERCGPDDGCEVACRSAVCGDGVVEGDEECDPVDDGARDGCRLDCTINLCGNGIVDEGEECDEGTWSDTNVCKPDCTFNLCGNGVLDPDEQCDDGGFESGDGCSPHCFLE